MGRIYVGTSGWCGLHPRDFARHYDVVEFNWTFHERDSDVEHYRKVASELREMHLHAVLKVSGVATHEWRLRSPGQWWPQLWAKYGELQKVGVLGGLLWQLAPSHRCTRQTLSELEELAKSLPQNVLHVFEFRHSSWYGQYREEVVALLRRWGLCMAWIHIKNSDGWCGDLEDGWPSLARTCNTAYLRLFGTKQKAIGRYGEEVIRESILPMVQGAGAPKDSIVVFAQADVPNHAKADASFMTELLGRGDHQPGRSTKWERDVLVATLGLGIGNHVSGKVQRITHRTVFIDIGRSCRAFLDANHARRAGLLESLKIGTQIDNLEVQHLDFQGEWGIVGLSCHKASVSLGAEEDHSSAVDAEQPTQAVPAPHSRWLRQSTESSEETPAAQAVAALEERQGDRPPLRRPRWANRCFEGLAEIGRASGSRHVKPVDPEQEEERLRAKRMATKARRDERVGRWARALVEKAIAPRPPSKRSRSEGPAPRTRKEEVMIREELKKEEAAALGRAEKRKGEQHPRRASQEAQEDWSQDQWAQAQVLPGEPGDGPIACSVDEFLLMQIERREGEEAGYDAKNSETFGPDDDVPGWSTGPVVKVQERVVERRMWRPGLHDDKLNRNKIRSEPSELSKTIASYPKPPAHEVSQCFDNSDSLQNSEEKREAEVIDPHETESDAPEEDWHICMSTNQNVEDFWEEEMEKASDDSEAEEISKQTPDQIEDKTTQAKPWNWVPRLRVGSWADASEGADEPKQAEEAAESLDVMPENPEKVAPDSEVEEVIHTGPVDAEPLLNQADHAAEDPQPKRDKRAAEHDKKIRSQFNAAQNEKNAKNKVGQVRMDDDAEEAPAHQRRAWRGRAHPEQCIPEEPKDAVESSDDEIVLAEQLVAQAGADEALETLALEGARHTARCILCGLAYSLNIDMSDIGDSFCCQDLGRSCFVEEDSENEVQDGTVAKGDQLEQDIDEETDEDVFVAVCDECGATHVTHIDFMGLGLNFHCGMVGARCDGDAEPQGDAESGRSIPVLPPSRSQLNKLSVEEKRDLFERYAVQRQEERVSKKHIHKSLQELAPRKGQQERYRDNNVVTRKGERFVKVDVSLDPGPGCEIGGIIGWRTKQGRRGLGIKKMTKEEADKICISNKNRSHTTKTISGGEKKVTFETKWSRHTAGSMQAASGSR